MKPSALWSLAALPLVASCAVIDVQPGAALDPHARWALLPVLDYSDSPQSGERVEQALTTLVRTRLHVEAVEYPAPAGGPDGGVPAELDPRQRYEQALDWARKQGFVYGITGSVQEWRYRSGADAEAAVGLTVRVVDVQSGRTLWTATGARSGWGRETVSATAQRLLRDMLARVEIK